MKVKESFCLYSLKGTGKFALLLNPRQTVAIKLLESTEIQEIHKIPEIDKNQEIHKIQEIHEIEEIHKNQEIHKIHKIHWSRYKAHR